jgi:hypothetical protein
MFKQVLMSAALLCTAGMLVAQEGMPAGERAMSPKEQATATIGGKTITIDYNSPRVRGRQGKIFTSDGLISHDQHYPVWRAGANEATTLKSSTNLMIGSLMVPAGTYTLFADISNPAQWTLVVSKAVGEWGLDYDKSKDLGRVPMKMTKPGALVENLKWTIKPTMGNEGTITLEWENQGASVSLMVH